MLIGTMGAMMERMGPMTVHVLKTKAPRGKPRRMARKVYRQMRRDFMVASPFMLHASVPELLAASWAVVRESLFTGEVARGDKEIVAWAVSEANRCPFCVDAHHAAVRAARASDAALEAWGQATAAAHHDELRAPPFSEAERAEYFGTAVAFHYLNRMVSVFLDEKMMPVPNFMNGMTRFMAKIMMGGMIRKGRKNEPGESTSVLPEFDETLSWRPAWAESHPHVAAALGAWSAINEQAAREHLGEDFVAAVGAAIDAWQGGSPGMGDAWLADVRPPLPEEQLAAANLALLTVMAPYMVDDARIKAVLKAGMKREQALVTTAWAAQRAARRVGEWIALPAIPDSPAADPELVSPAPATE